MQRAARQLALFPETPAAPDSPAPAPGRPPGVAVRESKRARRMSIKVYPHGRVEVVVPRRVQPAEVEAFVSENRAWIEQARAELGGNVAPEAFAPPDTISLPAIGREIAVLYREDTSLDRVRFRDLGDQLTLRGPVHDRAKAVSALKRWLSNVARREFEPRLVALSAETGIGYERMHIRAQRTCWGSRSSSGTISLNLSLLFVRPALLRYLLLHELCHGRHMNHSARFWKLVAKFEPDCRALDRELGESWRAVPAWTGIL